MAADHAVVLSAMIESGIELAMSNDEVAAVRAAIAALRAEAGAVGWMPIESAPKDGTRVLAYAGLRPFIARHGRTIGWWDDNDLMRDPTHWQPLPDAAALAQARRNDRE